MLYIARHLSPGSLQSGKTLRDHQVPSPSLSGSTPFSTLATSTPSLNPTPSLEEATPIATPLPPGHERCSYCGSVMPSLRLIMHERHCAQSTYKCPLCKWVLVHAPPLQVNNYINAPSASEWLYMPPLQVNYNLLVHKCPLCKWAIVYAPFANE